MTTSEWFLLTLVIMVFRGLIYLQEIKEGTKDAKATTQVHHHYHARTGISVTHEANGPDPASRKEA